MPAGPGDRMPSLSCRVALYSNDTMGLGHMRRNLLLAQTLRHSRVQAVVLMIAGAREASLVTTTAGVDCVALPSLRKDGGGEYHPRHLAVPLEELLADRKSTRLNSSHSQISYAVFCLKKKKNIITQEYKVML